VIGKIVLDYAPRLFAAQRTRRGGDRTRTAHAMTVACVGRMGRGGPEPDPDSWARVATRPSLVTVWLDRVLALGVRGATFGPSRTTEDRQKMWTRYREGPCWPCRPPPRCSLGACGCFRRLRSNRDDGGPRHGMVRRRSRPLGPGCVGFEVDVPVAARYTFDVGLPSSILAANDLAPSGPRFLAYHYDCRRRISRLDHGSRLRNRRPEDVQPGPGREAT